MTTDVKHEFGSRPWLEEVKAILEAIMADAAAVGEIDDDTAFTMCEVYTDVPPHISDTGRVAWHCRLEGRRLTVVFEEADDADVKIVGDWATIAPTAAVEYDLTDAATIPPEIVERMMTATQEGRLTMTVSGTVQAPPAFLAAHNRIARITKTP